MLADRDNLRLIIAVCGMIILLCTSFARGLTSSHVIRNSGKHAVSPICHSKKQLGRLSMMAREEAQFIDDIPLNQIFQKAVVLQRSGDRSGALREYEQFLRVAKSHDVDPSLYVS
jgi:hypothetical protein